MRWKMTNGSWSPTPFGKKLAGCLSDFWALSSLLAPVALCILCLATYLLWVGYCAKAGAQLNLGGFCPDCLDLSSALICIFPAITLFMFRLSVPGRRFNQISCLVITVIMSISTIEFVIPSVSDSRLGEDAVYAVFCQIASVYWLLSVTSLLSAKIDPEPSILRLKKFWILNLTPLMVLFTFFLGISADSIQFFIFLAIFIGCLLSPFVFIPSWIITKISLWAEKNSRRSKARPGT